MVENIEKGETDQDKSEKLDSSDGGMISTNGSIMTVKNVDIKMGSDDKRKAESGDENTEDGKRQRNHDQK